MDRETAFAIANKYIKTIMISRLSTEEWFAIEAEIDKFITSLPHELRDDINDFFADSGAGECLYMMCSALRLCNKE